MKKPQTRRILLLLGCAVLLVCLSVGATLAYLTSQTAPVVNTFTVGNVTITMDEAKVNAYGEVLTGEEAGRDTKNTYKLMPAHTYKKDPTIHVQPLSEKCYLFVKVENGLTIEAPNTTTTPTIAHQLAQKGWTPVAEGSNVYYYKDIIDQSAEKNTAFDVVVFDTFSVAGTANEAALAANANNEIRLTGYAVQSEGFDGAPAAWAATFGAPTNP